MGIEVVKTTSPKVGVGVKDNIKVDEIIGSSEESFSSILGKIDLKELLNLASSEDFNIEIEASLDVTSKIVLDDIKQLNLDDLVVDDLVKLVSVLKSEEGLLKGDFVDVKFKKLVNESNILAEFKDVKSLKELISVADKYGLNLKKIEFTKEYTSSFNEILKTVKGEEALKKLDTVLAKESSVSKDIVLKTLSILDKKVHVEEVLVQTKDTKVSSPLKSLLGSAIEALKKDVDTKSAEIGTNTKVDVKSVKEQVSEKVAVVLNKENIEAKEIKSDVVSRLKQVNMNEGKELKAKDVVVAKEDLKSVVKADKIDVKVVEKQHNITRATPITTQRVVEGESALLRTIASVVDEDTFGGDSIEKSEGHENKTTLKDIKSTLSGMPKVQIKETLAKFSTTLEEQVREYKPPLMKMKLALNPNNLGEVEVTIVTRGNNLNINLTSNTQTMAIFTQNQADFRAAISGLGFSEFNMSFQDKEGQQQKEKEQEHASNNQEQDDEWEEAATTTSVDILTPKYI